jgi:uroporphyrinogen decarboxylase
MKKNMTLTFKLNPDFDRFVIALRGGIPDRVPAAELSVDASIKEALLGRRIETVTDDVDFWHQAGYDYAWIRATYDIDNLFPGAYESGTGHAPAPIKTLRDYEAFPWKDPRTLDYSILDKAAKQLPDGMKIVSGEGGMFSFSWMLMGMDRFCLEWADESTFAKYVLNRVCETILEINKQIIEHPAVGALWLGDDLAFGTGTFMSPHWFRKHIFPVYKEIGEMCNRKGKPFIFHSDGNLMQVIDDLIGIGINALHPIEPLAMDIVEIKHTYGSKLALIGNIDLVHTLPYGTEEEIYSEVRDRIRTVGSNGGYVVSSANSIPAHIPLQNFITMLNVVHDCGKYPLC